MVTIGADMTIEQIVNQSFHDEGRVSNLSTYTVQYSGVVTCPHNVQYCVGAKYYGIDENNHRNFLSTSLFCSNKSAIYHHAILTFGSSEPWNTTLEPFIQIVHNCSEDHSYRISEKSVTKIRFESENRKSMESFEIDLGVSTFIDTSDDRAFYANTQNIRTYFKREDIGLFTNDTRFYRVELTKPVTEEVSPGEIATQPISKIVFNAPYDVLGQTHFVEALNLSSRRIRYTAKTTSNKRLWVHPTSGSLGPEEAVLFSIYCSEISYKQNNLKSDNFTIEWKHFANPAVSETFQRDWFEEHDLIRNKILPIEYNT